MPHCTILNSTLKCSLVLLIEAAREAMEEMFPHTSNRSIRNTPLTLPMQAATEKAARSPPFKRPPTLLIKIQGREVMESFEKTTR